METVKEHQEEHILVCLSSSPSNKKIIRTGSQMSQAFGGTFTALYVASNRKLSDGDRKRLDENIKLAEQCGATIETTYGEDIPFQIAEFARLAKVTKIVLGRSDTRKRHIWNKEALTDKLLKMAPDINIHIIPDSGSNTPTCWQDKIEWKFKIAFRDIAKTAVIVAVATLIGSLFEQMGFISANIITIYLFCTLVIAVFTEHWLCNLMGALGSVLAFNYFFTEPKFTFAVYDRGYPVTFLIMFASGILTGTLMSKIRRHSVENAKVAFRNKILFETNQMLQKAATDNEILVTTARQLQVLLNRQVDLYVRENQEIIREPFSDTQVMPSEADEQEKEIVDWVFRNNKRAGATTDMYPKAEKLYLAIRLENEVYGVVGIQIGRQALEMFEYSMILSILGECALAMESKKNSREKEEIALLAKSEQLRSDLLRSISHDLRTPLTAISGNACNLLNNADGLDKETKKLIYKDMYDDSLWLINIVENLLAVTRIDNGQMKLNISTEILEEIINEALVHFKRNQCEHHIEVSSTEDIILVKADSRLLIQVIVNLVDNAIKYTPKDSHISIHSYVEGDFAKIEVKDDGPGIEKEHIPHIFDMFYTANNSVADSRRSLGLGLALCKTIINAHGGSIDYSSNEPHGSIFTIVLPAGKVELYE